MVAILITGGSGYLGQFLACQLSREHEVDLETGDGLKECLENFCAVEVVVNCAAMSSPGACEKEPEKAWKVNVPTMLLDGLGKLADSMGRQPLLIHISTDQVYDGGKSFWCEEDICNPVNVYGSSKLAAEKAVQDGWANHVILRSSIIYGPQSPVPVSRPLLLDFIVSSLKSGQATKFIEDEFRCPIYVNDIVNIVNLLIGGKPLVHRLFNLGGPERLSRVDMAVKVADQLKLDAGNIVSVASASFERNVTSPLDISMKIDRLTNGLGMHTMPFTKALSEIFPST